MPKKTEAPAEVSTVDSPVEVTREVRIEALKLRAAELPWDPDHLREFLTDLVDLL
jgi:hypothetical protein